MSVASGGGWGGMSGLVWGIEESERERERLIWGVGGGDNWILYIKLL